VLEYRERIEQQAKETYLDARVKRLEAEGELAAMVRHKHEVLQKPIESFDDRLVLDMYILRCDERETEQGLVIQVLEGEEETLRQGWLERKKEYEAIMKLYERELDEYEKEATRREQAELDEWAVLHRAVA
jgi:flagellar export protein FliJ